MRSRCSLVDILGKGTTLQVECQGESNRLGAETRQIEADIQSVYDRLPADGRLRVVIRGANHFTFSEDGALFEEPCVEGGAPCVR